MASRTVTRRARHPRPRLGNRSSRAPWKPAHVELARAAGIIRRAGRRRDDCFVAAHLDGLCHALRHAASEPLRLALVHDGLAADYGHLSVGGADCRTVVWARA